MSKSFIAAIEEKILKATKPDYMDSIEKVDEFLSELSLNPQKPPKGIFKSTTLGDMEVYTFGDSSSNNTILYIHGGAYVGEINYQHLLYCWLLAKRLNSYVIAPVYPLAPNHSADETFDLITDLYKALMQKDNLTLMGDSAGGGFVLGFCQYLKEVSLPQPNHIVTFSPWVDISLSGGDYDSENDPILGEIGLREIGKSWSGDLDTQNYKVSPLFGDNDGLAPMLIFAGSNEIFYNDIKKYVENLKSSNVNVKFIRGEGLFHIYPLFPIPEARNAFKEIKKEIIK